MSVFPESPVFNTASMLRRNKWLIRLRWIAILGLLTGIALLTYSQLGSTASINRITFLAGVLVICNLIYTVFTRMHRQFNMLILVSLLNIQMVVDLLLLTLLIHFTGSDESPLAFFYVFHIILASIMFPGGFSYIYSFLVIILYSGLLILDQVGVIQHFCFLHEVHPVEDAGVVVVKWGIAVITVFAAAYLAQNVTARHRRVYDSLKIANRKLQEINESKTTFFRFASHEMKAPIATIQSTLMVIEDVLDDKVDERVHDMLGRAIKRTSEVIAMLKDLADLTYGNFQEHQKFESLDLKVILTELIENNRPDAERKQLVLSLETPKRDCVYWGDAVALKKIFLNLITNAIRYTPAGGQVNVSLLDRDNCFIFEVQDTGVGIPESEQVNIFKEFYRTARAREEVADGTGLGLAIVLRMVELHDGCITVNSKEGEGSRFTVTLPVEER